ncbi:Uncharacterized conserved protein YjdB, contains Ig-like domain [Tangfeifania diversioriginum]|uniref:Uncharacterized conserved protein YjdB, contains Ig-like domain n=1 Tax=Tangfeifania diversioriginum TaxID=1168035 RepID=A0A1M6GSJ5_9BACT|nr:Ig-like domain-containing protein [Tangfeifania diversioriginum]SHJ12877.1 Uncharacterized conserved protein YjdB, contains Ig-like domain [Tangfeifania diversioriginum]
MKEKAISIFVFSLFFIFPIQNCFSGHSNEEIDQNISQDFPDEIIFYTTGSSFSPVLTLRADAEVTWTWADSTTSNSPAPEKDYGSNALRANRVKVTPWSAVRRINIGYDAGDDGTPDIELVEDQRVYSVENLHLVAPYLKEWCSSYNDITELDFSNFTELETIECFLSTTLEEVNLTNTNKLKRACFEFNGLKNLDLSDSPLLQDLRAAANSYTTITLPNETDSLWHLCVHHNDFFNQHFFNDMSRYPNIADLLIEYTNQQGELVIQKSNPNRNIEIRAFGNEYTSVDFRGALKNEYLWGIVDMDHNELSEVNIEGCVQIKQLDLSYNKLTSAGIDDVLRQMDELGTDPQNGTIDLRNNQPPTYTGWVHKNNLENKGWTVSTDLYVPVGSISITGGNTISTDNSTLQLEAEVMPADATNKTVAWSVSNETGRATINASGLLTAEKDGTVTVVATAVDGSGVTGDLQVTISNQVIPVESISITGGNTISTDNGTLQLEAEVIPADATNKTVTWSVSNETGRATINASGLLTAEKDGTVTVVATAVDGSGVTGDLQVTISNQVIPVESISITGGNTISTDNGTLQLEAEVMPADATNKTVAWSVSNETGRATINASGQLTAEKDGTVTVVATAADGSGVTGDLQVTISNQVIHVESISIIGGNTISTDNGTLQLEAEVIPADATNKTVAWSVSNETGSATINASGQLTAEKDGTVTAVATAADGSGVTGELQITISNQKILVESIEIISTISGDTIRGIGRQVQFDVILTPSDATNQNIEWSVENITGEAIIDSTGLLTTQYPGVVKVIAKATDESNHTSTKEYVIVIPLGIELNSSKLGVKIFPNPTEGEMKIQIEGISDQGADIEIWDPSGRLLMKRKVFEKLSYFSLESFGGNNFLIIIRTNNELIVHKVIKNR